MTAQGTKDEKKAVGDFTLRLPKNREQNAFFEIYLRELDEPTYMAAATLIGKGKEVETVKFLLKNLWVGCTPIDEVLKNFISVRAASEPMLEILNPASGELKKN